MKFLKVSLYDERKEFLHTLFSTKKLFQYYAWNYFA